MGWTSEQYHYVMSEYSRGVSIESISKDTGISVETIQKMIETKETSAMQLYDAFEDEDQAKQAGQDSGYKFEVRKLNPPQDGGRLKYGVWIDESATKETAGDWNQRYDQAKPDLKRELDQGAQDMFKQNFRDLETDEQKKVIDWMGTDRMIEGAGREWAQKQPLSDIMKRAGNFNTFKTEALRQGYSEDEIESYLNEIRDDLDREIYGDASKETSSNATVHDANYDPEWDVNYEALGGGRYKITIDGQDLGEANSIQEAKNIAREYMDEQRSKHGE